MVEDQDVFHLLHLCYKLISPPPSSEIRIFLLAEDEVNIISNFKWLYTGNSIELVFLNLISLPYAVPASLIAYARTSVCSSFEKLFKIL